LLAWLPWTAARVQADDDTLRVGIPETFFDDMGPVLVREVTEPFALLLRKTSGVKSQPVTGGQPLAVARRLSENKLQLAILHGCEFAWARAKYADLEPLMIANRAHRDYCAYVLVRKESAPAGFADLKGKDIAVPKRATQGCRLFLDRLCRQNGGQRPADYFAHVVHPAGVETGLDNLARGNYTAALVDTNGLDFYKDLKPGVFARFKVLAQSEPLPPIVLAYRKGALADAMRTRIRMGLRVAGDTDVGRDLMKIWHIHEFAGVPDHFAQTLADSLKRYPPPSAPAAGEDGAAKASKN
jgi:ABC-type phosphate/phosphonate transport system substrate-binding protein